MAKKGATRRGVRMRRFQAVCARVTAIDNRVTELVIHS